MKKLFIKAFVTPFYKAFFGFFVVVYIVLGLLMDISQHILIGERILKNPIAFGTLLLAFLIYGWLQYRFHVKLIQGLKYRVFHQLALLKPTDFSGNEFVVWVCNHLLLFIYSSFFTYLSIQNGYWFQPLLLWLLLTGMFFAHKTLLFSMLSRPLPDQKATILKRYRLKHIPIKRVYWLMVHLKENRPLLLFACKILLLILLKLFFYSFSTGAYDERWLQFGLLCVAFINFPIWLEKKEFEQEKLAYFLNLPRTFLRKAWLHLNSTLLILAPEILYLIIQYPDLSGVVQFFSLVLLIISLNLGLYALINSTKAASDLPRNAVISFFSLFFLIIFGFPALVISALALVVFFKSIHSDYNQ
jgi:hypothetical protein